GDRAGALALYRKLAARTAPPTPEAVARGLTRCGQAAEAARLLERRLRTLPEAPNAVRRALAEAYLSLGQPAKVVALYQSLLAQVEPSDGGLPEDVESLQRSDVAPLARALETLKPAAARRAYAAVILAHDATADDYQAYLRLAIAARAFDEARSVLGR